MTDTQMFAFESDFVASLRCVPMAVRLKLDLCGVKLTLRQWSRFTRADRFALLMRPCGEACEIADYRAALTALIAERTGEVARSLAEAPCGQWDIAHRPPAVVIAYARSLGLAPPTPGHWAALTRLQRFALIKLTRENHDNLNFAPAMREFGLAATPESDQTHANRPAIAASRRGSRPSRTKVRPRSESECRLRAPAN